MGVEKKITITGVDSILFDYEFAAGPHTPPGAFRVDPNNGNRDYTRSRKLTEVFVHDRDGQMLDARSLASHSARVEIITGGASIVVSDYVDGNDQRVYIEYSRAGFRSSGGRLYHPDAEMLAIKIDNEPVPGWEGKGTIEIFYAEKLPVAASTT